MLLDANALSVDASLSSDICIIGAGAAGLTMAKELSTSRKTVILLEAGGLKFDPAHQSLYDGEVSFGSPHASPILYRQRRLGGTTTIWGGRCVPFDEIDFENRDYVPLSGWPFRRNALIPYYQRAQSYVDAGDFDYSAATAMPPEIQEFIDDLKIAGLDTNSIERFSLPTDFSKSLRQTLIKSSSVLLYTDATCLRFDTENAGQNVTRARCRTLSGRFFSVHSRVFVVAAGGIETVRILGSSNQERPAGLGNHSDFLGRCYMCHLEASVGLLKLHPSARKIRYGFDLTRDGVYARRRFTIPANIQRDLQTLNMVARPFHANVVDPRHQNAVLSAMFLAKRLLIPEFRRKLSMVERSETNRIPAGPRFWSAHLANILRGSPVLLSFGLKWIRQRHLAVRKLPYVALRSPQGVYPIDTNGEQAPNRESRIVLLGELDRFGLSKVGVQWRSTTLDTDSLAKNLCYMAARLSASGCATLELEPDFNDRLRQSVPVGGHHIGTARMSKNQHEGVVDSNGKVHAVHNLFVAGSAIFPTSSHANPTLTLVALSIRIADHIRNQI